MPGITKILFFAFVIIVFSYSAQSDSSLLKNKKWNNGIEVSMDNYFFKERMPFYKNSFSAGATVNFCLIRAFKKNNNKTFALRIGLGYMQYNIIAPDLDHFFGVSHPASPAYLYYPFDSCSYKPVRLRYFNIPISYTFNFRQKKKLGWGIGGELNFLNMPRSFVINENYSFEYAVPSKTPPFFNYTNQENKLVYDKNVVLPKTVLYFNYRFKRNNILLKVSKCMFEEVFRDIDQRDNDQYNKYQNAYYNGSGGWNTINLYRIIYSGVAVSIMYQHVF